ncbi:MAG: hypothetical protein IPN53_17965 [Comamonadaceae bacterium]|nr:hypothetical protein [Comamonadaceae bacterium]
MMYARQKPKAVDEEYTRHPFYGTLRMLVVISKAEPQRKIESAARYKHALRVGPPESTVGQ